MTTDRQPMASSKRRANCARVSTRRWSLPSLGASVLAGFASIAICSNAVLAAPAIHLNGAPTTVTAVVRDNEVFVPLHGFFEKLNTTMRVTPAHVVIAHKGSADIARLAVASRQATVNGASRILTTPPFMHGSTVFVPLRFISEAAGASVVYISATHAVNITAAPIVAAAITSAIPAAIATTTDSVAAVAPAAQEHGMPWWVWLLLALVVLALLFAFLRRRKPEPIIKTRSRSSDPIIKTRR